MTDGGGVDLDLQTAPVPLPKKSPGCSGAAPHSVICIGFWLQAQLLHFSQQKPTEVVVCVVLTAC